ncbi:MAG: hypothetical protein IJY31_08535 [Muribaculaceae bacterium]|nr:hypothetical protein [Muribaculaceae bacterium]
MANTISHDDILFATVSQHGNTILTLKLSGLTSIKDLLRRLHSTISGCIGLVTLIIRNGSQGWVMQQPLFLGNKTQQEASSPVQLTLF